MSAHDFSQRLVETLRNKKTSQTRVANELNVSRTAVNKWTKGGSIDDNNLELLANFLNVDKLWLKYGVNANLSSTTPTTQYHENISEVHLHGSSDIVTWEWDLILDKVSYSKNAEQVYGVRIDSNSDFWELMSPESRRKLENDYEKIVREGGAHEMDFCIVKNNEERWIASRAVGVKDHNGKITRIIGTSMDNTLRKQYELSLQRFEQFFNLLLKRTSKLIVFTDLFGEIIKSNQSEHHPDISYLTLQQQLYGFMATQHNILGTTQHNQEIPITLGDQRALLIYQAAMNDLPGYIMFEFQ
ncbi:helix-turn-helix domain-containing protein [Bacterioplanoides sp.]|uniref:helix-turn-helix domain-containing protein n=1 Tax=Bacterioplanoides sp. TaxID=2066072 RepID=UPI003B5A4EAC